MNMKLLLFSAFLLFIFIAVSRAATDGYVTITLNRTVVWWNDTIVSNGTANYTNGTGISEASLTITLNSVTYCTNTTSTSGIWSCTFQAPNELGTYTFEITVTNSTGSAYTNSTVLYVKPSYGGTPVGKTDRVVLEQPMLIEEPTGLIRQIWAKVKVWKS